MAETYIKYISIFSNAALVALIWTAFITQIPAQNLPIAEAKQSQLKKVRVNGVELNYQESGKGIPVIFVHGALDDYRMWTAQVEPFSEHYRVINYSRRYNYPNQNLNIKPDHSALVEADDLAALIRKLKLKRVHVVGYSYGAYTALFLAVKYPKLVRTLVLSEAPAFSLALDKPDGKLLVNEFLDNLWKPAAVAFNNNEREKALRLTVKYFAGADVFEQVPENMCEYWRSNLREWQALTTSRDAFPELSREEIRKIKVPVLMLSGEQTLRVLKFVDDELQPLLLNGERVTFQKASHDMWSEQPEALRQTVLAFLAKH